MRKILKRERDITLDWACGFANVTEAAKKLKTTRQGAYTVFARALKQIHYETKD